MEDKLVKALDGHVRIICCNSINTVKEGQRRHVCSPTATAALGRTITGAVVLGSMLKQDQYVSLIIDGDGPGGKIIAESDDQGNVRGYVSNPQVTIPIRESDGKLDVASFVGREGTLKVIKDLNMKEPFSGEVSLQNSEIAYDLTYYFTVSEQTPSVVSLGVYVDENALCTSAGGLVIQLLPEHTEEDIVKVEEIIANLKPISSILKEVPEPKDIILGLFPDAKIVEESKFRFQCNCSVDRMKAACMLLTDEDKDKSIEEAGAIEVKCKFCNDKHLFDRDLEVICEK